MKKALQLLAVFACFFPLLLGVSLIARGLEVAHGPLTVGPLLLPQQDWDVYRLDLPDPLSFYAGCAVTGLSLAFLWGKRSTP